MMFVAKVKYFDHFDETIKTHRLFVSGKDYVDASKKIVDYYSDSDIDKFSLKAFSLNDFVIFEDDKKELFKQAVEATLIL